MIITALLLQLISNAVTLRRDKSILFNRTAQLGFIVAFLLSYRTLSYSYLTEGVGLYDGLFNTTSTTQNFTNFMYIISIIILQLTAFYPRKIWLKLFENPTYKYLYDFKHNSDFTNKMAEQFIIMEYPLFILFTVAGGVFFLTSGDIVSIFLSIELQSYGLYLLATTFKNSESATSAGLTYYLLGSLSSTIILLGCALIYSNCAITALDSHYIMTNIFNVANCSDIMVSRLYNLSTLDTSLLVMSVGLLFKSSAAPFHFWAIDVYDAMPTIVTTFVTIIAKISILVLLLDLVHYTSNLFVYTNFNWTNSLLISSFFSLIVGSVLGLSQLRIKRLLAYSTISHIGFMLLAMAINTLESSEAFIFYLMQYSLSNLNIFFILIAIGISIFPLVCIDEAKEDKKWKWKTDERNNSPIQYIRELRGYFNINPILALSMVVTLFSFVGIPPLMGFFAKQMVIFSAINNGYIFLTIIAILTSVISACYYLYITKEIFFHDTTNYVINEEFVHKKPEFLEFRYKLLYNLGDDRKKYKNITPVKDIEGKFDIRNVTLSSFLSFTISTLTVLLILFMLCSKQTLRMARIMSLLIVDA